MFTIMTTTSTPNEDLVQRAKQRYGLLFGVLAGVAFTLTTWGTDGFDLAGSHGLWPWIKLGMGGTACIILGGLVNWLAIKISRWPVTLLLWALTGYAFGWLAGRVPFQGVTFLVNRLNPELARLIDYPYGEGMQARLVVTLVVTVGLSVLASVFVGYLVEQSSAASSLFGRLMPIVAWMVMFGLAGSAADSMFNQPLRAPVMVMDDLVQFALDNENIPPGNKAALDAHLGAVGSIRPLLHRPRRLFLGSYDDLISMVQVLIDFDGTWVRCYVVHEQPGYCEQVQ
jgi:hypothetical protein